jgi:predicted nucleic acid-binding protein
MKPSVYIETTILGHVVGSLPADQIVAGQMLDTRRWWNDSRGAFDLFSSEIVRVEASRGDSQAAAERLEAMRGIPLLPISEDARELAKLLVVHHALPAKARVDALHIAIAATNGMAYLLTWNCRHFANATLRLKIQQVCRNRGFEGPTICTPTELREVQP